MSNDDKDGVGIPVEHGGVNRRSQMRCEQPPNPTENSERDTCRHQHGNAGKQCDTDEKKDPMNVPEIHF